MIIRCKLNNKCLLQSKWKEAKYSALERRRRALHNTAVESNQPKIDEVYELVKKMDALAKADTKLGSQVAKITAALTDRSPDSIMHGQIPLFADLYECFRANNRRHKQGRRYDDDIKKFAAHVFIVGGRLNYETLSANLPLPSISTVSRVLHNEYPQLVEGKLRAKELKTYLLANGHPMHVWLSEDGTRISGKVQYDATTNQLVGIVQNLDANTGLPVPAQLDVNTAADIANHFAKGKISNYAYVVMAQPITSNASPFCLCIFGTDNIFKTDDVLRR